MAMFDAEWLTHTLIVAPPLLLSLVVHEYAHARTALAFGDPTAKSMGRVSLNPLVHLDPIGTICLLFSGFIGWARPVPVNKYNLHPPRLGDIAVSLAGPLSNLCLAIIAGLMLHGVLPLLRAYPNLEESAVFLGAVSMLVATMMANIGLFVFNLLPLFPLDGHHIAREILPVRHHGDFMNWQMRYGQFVLMAIIFVPQFVPQLQPYSPVSWLFRHIGHMIMVMVGLPGLL